MGSPTCVEDFQRRLNAPGDHLVLAALPLRTRAHALHDAHRKHISSVSTWEELCFCDSKLATAGWNDRATQGDIWGITML